MFSRCAFDSKIIGWFAILVCAVTWEMDIAGVVEKCIYCQTQRTVIGLMGVIFLLPVVPLVTRWLIRSLGYFVIYVACAQLFMHTRVLDFFSTFTVLAAAALFLVTGMLIVSETLHPASRSKE